MSFSPQKTTRAALPYRLGELPLITPTLEVATQDVDFVHTPPLPRGGVLTYTGRDTLIRSQPIDGEIDRLTIRPDYFQYVAAQFPRYTIDLRMGWDDYRQRFSSKTRNSILRKVKKFKAASGGTLHWKRYATADELLQFFPLAWDVSARTYQETLLDAGLPRDDAYVSDAVALAGKNQLRAYILFREERPVAYLFCPANNGVLLYDYLGYDPDIAKLSPGTVLQWLALEDIFTEQAFDTFDFTEGEGAHKRLFATNCQRCADVFLLQHSVENVAKVTGQVVTQDVSQRLSSLAERWGLKSRLKRMIRTASTLRRSAENVAVEISATVPTSHVTATPQDSTITHLETGTGLTENTGRVTPFAEASIGPTNVKPSTDARPDDLKKP